LGIIRASNLTAGLKLQRFVGVGWHGAQFDKRRGGAATHRQLSERLVRATQLEVLHLWELHHIYRRDTGMVLPKIGMLFR
jgi:hypothetical protein